MAKLIVVWVAGGIGLTAFVAWGRAAFPRIAAEADRLVERTSSRKTFWVGLVNVVVALLVVVLLGKVGQAVKPVGLLAALALFYAGVVLFRGALGIWPGYGRLILGPDSAATALVETLSGGALLSACALLFPVGIVFFAYALVKSMGVGVLLFVDRPAPEPAPKG